jgi:hypothetical protein
MKVKKYVNIYHEVIASLKNVDSSPFYWKIIFRKLIMETAAMKFVVGFKSIVSGLIPTKHLNHPSNTSDLFLLLFLWVCKVFG